MESPQKTTRSGWSPGRSGNPKGRPKGVGEVAKIRAAISARVPELLEMLMDRALAGDIGAARLLLERSVAPLKSAEATQAIALPDGSLTDQGRAVLSAVAAGKLAPSQGAALVGAIGTLAKVIEIVDLEARIQALEAANGEPKN